MKNTLPFQGPVLFYKRENETMFIKHTKNISFTEGRKTVESYMGTKTYANVLQKANQTPQDSTPTDNYKKLIEKLINLKTNKWPKFQENLKRNRNETNQKSKKKQK